MYAADDAEFYYSKVDDAILLRVTEQRAAQADTTYGAIPAVFTARVRGSGFIEVRLDTPDGAVLTQVPVSSPDAFQKVSVEVAGLPTETYDLYIVFSDAGVAMDSWGFSAVGD